VTILGLLHVRSNLVFFKDQFLVQYFSRFFINDLPYELDLNTKLYTTLSETFDVKTRTFDTVIQDFKDKLSLFTNWCIFNRLDINWTKTHIMVVSSNDDYIDYIKIHTG